MFLIFLKELRLLVVIKNINSIGKDAITLNEEGLQAHALSIEYES